MAQELKDFFHELRQEVLLNASTGQDFLESEFAAHVSEELVQAGIIDGFEPCPYRASKGGVRIDGYWFDEEQGTLSLFIVDYTNRLDVQSLTKTDTAAIFKRLTNFFTSSLDGFYRELEETSPGYGLAREINDRRSAFSKVEMYLLSERLLSDRLDSVEDAAIDKWKISYNIWDISRLYRLSTAQGAREELIIDLGKTGLQCLPAHLSSDQYESYLVVIPGQLLADLYGRYGSRLLEQNVRSFLQARGKVNKGIRTTIMNAPEMFFAFNNGITATATEVTIEKKEGASFLKSLHDLQIVNGGQTTASLFHTQRKDKASLDSVFVQMKLSVVDKEKAEEIVPKISEYANTQNKVSAADFFSNHPFHIRMEEFSRRIWAPAQGGSQRESKWFYERARGQYADGQSKLSPGEKRRFLAEYPKAQMFTKTDMAKYDNLWDEHPKHVNLGAQKNFARYAERIGREWEKKPDQFNEFYYKRVVARAIIFKTTEKTISRQAWYNGGYRANIVAYTLALISKYCEHKNKHINFRNIWNKQEISEAFLQSIEVVSKVVHDDIINPPTGISNVTEWCKKEACWDHLRVRIFEFDNILPESFKKELIDPDKVQESQKTAEKTQKIDNGIAAQAEVIRIGAESWLQLRSWCATLGLLSPKEQGILDVATKMPRKIPSEKQSLILMEILEKAEVEGWSG